MRHAELHEVVWNTRAAHKTNCLNIMRPLLIHIRKKAEHNALAPPKRVLSLRTVVGYLTENTLQKFYGVSNNSGMSS
jgi:hypothetical protein